MPRRCPSILCTAKGPLLCDLPFGHEKLPLDHPDHDVHRAFGFVWEPVASWADSAPNAFRYTPKAPKPVRLMSPRELQAFAREAARFFTEIGERARAEHPEQYGLKAKPKAKRKRKP